MQWYYKGGLICGLLWGIGRALGMAGDAQRQVDVNFLFGLMLTIGGWSMVFLVVDMGLRALGLRKGAPAIDLAPSGGVLAETDTPAAGSAGSASVTPPAATAPAAAAAAEPSKPPDTRARRRNRR